MSMMTLEDAVGIAIAEHQAGNLMRAEELYRHILGVVPEQPMVMHLLGVVRHQLGAHDEAMALIGRALTLQPDYAEAWSNFGSVQLEQGDIDSAVASFQRALELNPHMAQAYGNLGNAYMARMSFEKAEVWYRQAVSEDVMYVDGWVSLGVSLAEQNRISEAIDIFRHALSLDPRNAKAYNNLGAAYSEHNRLDEALECYNKATSLDPTHDDAWCNKGAILLEQGKKEEAMACFARAPGSRPDFATPLSNYIFSLHYDPEHTAEQVYLEALKWAEQFAPESLLLPPPRNTPDPKRKLKIGYVSGDWRAHPVGYFMENILRSHDRSQVEVFCYANQKIHDVVTDKLCRLADNWRDIYREDDDAAAALIRDDGIDLLIDLSGHSGQNRLQLFARKPAPVQMTWLGYFGTTGLSSMDYIIADAIAITPEEEEFYTETPLRMPENYLCFSPPDCDIAVSELPMLANGHVTFACFNKLIKMGDGVWDCWAKILGAVDHSRMILRSRAFEQPELLEQTYRQFESRGVERTRVDLLVHCARPEYLATYQKVDIILDTFPYAGGTTTVEALWMGVPVVSLRGRSFAGRIGPTILHHAGHGDWVSESHEEYIAKAIELANNPAQLTNVRKSLRDALVSSPVCDAPRFTRHLEQAFRDAWKLWCKQQGT